MPSLKPQTLTINISSLSIAKVLIVGAALMLLYVLRDIVAILFTSLIIASALGPMVAWLERHKIPRTVAILLIYAIFVAIFASAVLLLIPILVTQFQELSQSFPVYSDRVIALVKSYGGGSEDVIIAQIKASLKSVESVLLQTAGGVFGKIFDVIGGLAAVVIVAVVTFYMTVEESIMKKALNAVVPDQYHAYTDRLIAKVQIKIGQWFRAQVILCFIIFFFSFIGLSILNVQYALILALFAGLTEFIPLVGPILGAVPAVFIALSISPWLAIWVALLYMVIQWLENHLLVPKVMQQAVGINPLISVIVILMGAKIGGFVGVVLAIPIATVVIAIVGDLFGKDLDDRD